MAYEDKYRQLNSFLTQGYAVLLNVMIPTRAPDEHAEFVMNMLLTDIGHLGNVVAGPSLTGHYLCAKLEPAHRTEPGKPFIRTNTVYVYPADF